MEGYGRPGVSGSGLKSEPCQGDIGEESYIIGGRQQVYSSARNGLDRDAERRRCEKIKRDAAKIKADIEKVKKLQKILKDKWQAWQ